MTDGLQLLAQAIFGKNLILGQGLGLYALTRPNKNVKEAAKSGGLTAAAMLLGALAFWALEGLAFKSLSAQIGLYLVIGLGCSFIAHKLFSRESWTQDALYDSAIVGFVLILGFDGIRGSQALWLALTLGLGYLAALVVLAFVRERLEMAPVPKALRGVPILLIAAGLLGLAVLGFRL